MNNCHNNAAVAQTIAVLTLKKSLKLLQKNLYDNLSYQKLLEYVQKGFPVTIQTVDPMVRPYYNLRNGYSWSDGLVIYNSKRIDVPKALRKEVLARLHASHQGIERTQARARSTVFWPGITNDITNTVGNCEACSERLPSQPKEPMKTSPVPSRVFEQTATDLFEYGGKHYLVYVDRYSGWPDIHMWHNAPTSLKVIKQLRRWFVNMGIPLRVRSDGGPQYDSLEYREFFKAWGVNPPGYSTPRYAQSNGLAESAVKAMKALVAKSSIGGDIFCE